MRNYEKLTQTHLFLFALVFIIANIVFLISSCEKETQESQPEQALEMRAGIRLPVFYASSLTTDNWLLQGQPNYQNIQNVWKKSYVDSVTLERSQNALTNIGGVICGIYRVRVWDADTIIYQNEMYAKNGADVYTVVPTGNSTIVAYNHIEVIRQDTTQMYFDWNCGINKKRNRYEVWKDGVQGFEWINSQLCASAWFRFKHEF